MMLRKIFMIWAWACFLTVGHAQAENVLTVHDMTVPQGGETTLEIRCDFTTMFTAFQLEVSLPDGLSLVLDSDGKPVVKAGFSDTDHALSGSRVANGNYRFTCASMTNSALPQTDVLMQVTVVADEALAVGEHLTGEVVSVEFTRLLDLEGEELSNTAFAIVITDNRTLLDELSAAVPEAATGVDVRVKRTINAGEWSTLCLPFAMTQEQVQAAFGDDVRLGDFTGCETTYAADEKTVTAITVKFQIVTAIKANHPYMIRVSAPVTEFTVDGVDIDPEEEPSVDCDELRLGSGTKKDPYRYYYNSFVGTYVAQTEVPELTLFLNANKFWYSTGKTHMKAFRGYFDFYDVLTEVEEASAKVNFSVDETTGIDVIDNYNSHAIHHTPQSGIYNLQGRKVADHSQLKLENCKLPKGIYIMDGKKIIVR